MKPDRLGNASEPAVFSELFDWRNARGILACGFFVAVTASFRMLYVFVVIKHGTRRLAHVNVTAHPSAAWTLQQLREVIADADEHKYLIHDRDSGIARDIRRTHGVTDAGRF